jgi:AcrR family transcriptional regulator
MTTTQEHRSVEERRDQLVDAALAVLRDEGVAAVTTRAVTKRAGLPHGAFHYCFATKPALFRAVLERQLRTAMAAAFATDTAALTPEARITAGLTAHLDTTRADPATALALVELFALARRDPGLQDVADWEQRAYVDAVRAHLEAWTDDRRFRWTAPPETVARLLVALADGVSTAWLQDRDDVAASATIALAAMTTATLVDGGAS